MEKLDFDPMKGKGKWNEADWMTTDHDYGGSAMVQASACRLRARL